MVSGDTCEVAGGNLDVSSLGSRTGIASPGSCSLQAAFPSSGTARWFAPCALSMERSTDLASAVQQEAALGRRLDVHQALR